MSDEQQQFSIQALNKFRQWHFWWLVVFSLLLIISFVYYLPTKFLQQTMAPHSMMMPQDESVPHPHEISTASPSSTMTEMSAMTEMVDHATHGTSMYYEEGEVKKGLVINLNINPVSYSVGVPLNLNFFVNQKPDNVPILANQLQIEHEKLMHVIGVHSDMNEFFHIHPVRSLARAKGASPEDLGEATSNGIHPEFLTDNPAIFSVDHIFNKPGFYKIWSEVKKDGINYTIGHPKVNINGSGSKEEKKISFSRNVIAGDYQVSLKVSDVVVKAKEVDLSFDIHSLTGQEVDVENYLGTTMHLTIIKDDLKQFIHTHPEGHVHSQGPKLINITLAHGGVEDEPAGLTDIHQTTSGGDETIDFKITFPEAGFYKAFAQFRPKGIDLPADEALLAEFWIQVEEKGPFPVSQWWGLLIISVVLIAGLSWIVNRYLKVKPEDIKVKK